MHMIAVISIVVAGIARNVIGNILLRSLAFTLLPALFGVAQLHAQAMWPAASIARLPVPITQLRTDNGQIAAIVATSFVRELLDIKGRIESVAGIQAELWLTQGPAPNAWAAPSGNRNIIAFNLPMLVTFGKDKDALAAVMGHEMAHLVRQHVPARTNNAAVTDAFGAFFGALFEGVIQNKYQVSGVGQSIANIGTELAKTAFSRDQEREADKFGLEWMNQAGYDVQGALRVWTRMGELMGDPAFTFLSTHPASTERFENLKQQITKLPTRHAIVAAVQTPANGSPCGDVTRQQVATTTELSKSAEFSYVIQFAALRDSSLAKQIQERVAANCIESYIELVKNEYGESTRVRAGPYASRQEAEKARDQVRTIGLNGAILAIPKAEPH